MIQSTRAAKVPRYHALATGSALLFQGIDEKEAGYLAHPSWK
jgi:hypothetical protein